MPKTPTNDEIVREHQERRRELIQQHSRLAAERIYKLLQGRRKPTVDEIAAEIAEAFLESPN